ncbi:MAG: Transcriptional regulator, AfsR family, partial [uncultured Pseudonocardia sp.]
WTSASWARWRCAPAGRPPSSAGPSRAPCWSCCCSTAARSSRWTRWSRRCGASGPRPARSAPCAPTSPGSARPWRPGAERRRLRFRGGGYVLEVADAELDAAVA